MNNNVIPFRRRTNHLPPFRPTFPVTKSEPPRYSWQEPIAVTMETGVEFRVLYVALKSAGFDFIFDRRTAALVIKAPKPKA